MIATVRGLAALAVIAAGLAIVLAVDLARTRGGPIDRALWPGFDARAVGELTWTAPDVRVQRAGSAWSVCVGTASCSTADPGAVDAVVSALRAGRWHRRDAAGMAGHRTRTLAIAAGQGGAHRFELGEPLAGGDQVWLVADGAAVLVDGWVAHALFPAPVTLVVRQPFEAVATKAVRIEDPGSHTVMAIAAGTRRASGQWIDRGKLAALERALEDVTVSALPSGPLEVGSWHDGLVVTVGEQAAIAIGAPASARACPPGAGAVVGSGVRACVTPESWQAVQAAAAPLMREPADVRDPHVVPFTPTGITLDDGVTLLLTGSPVLADRAGTQRPADRDRAAEVVRVLASAPAPCGPPEDRSAHQVTVIGSDATLVLKLLAGDRVWRDDGACFQLPHADAELLGAASAAFVDTTRWVEDAATISTIAIDGVTYARDAVMGEWTRAGKKLDKPASAKIEALAAQLATVRAPALAAAPAAVAHRLTVTFTPPVGAPVTHTLELGAGCAAVVDGAPAQLPAALCAALPR